MITPETGPAPTASKSSGKEQFVPTAALEIDNVAPAEGDEVEFRVKARVTRVSGDGTYVQPISINDQPIAAPKPEAPAEETSDSDLMAMAKKSDADNDGSGY